MHKEESYFATIYMSSEVGYKGREGAATAAMVTWCAFFSMRVFFCAGLRLLSECSEFWKHARRIPQIFPLHDSF